MDSGILGVVKEDNYLSIDISGTVSRYHYFWLRDNSPDCRSPNGQRLHETNLLPTNIRPRAVEHTTQTMTIKWNDETTSIFSLGFLRDWAYDKPAKDAAGMELWHNNIGQQITRHDYDVVCSDVTALGAWLQDVAMFGFSLLKGVPTLAGTIFDVVDLFGFVRETNYGRLFEVQTIENASNLAYTPMPLSVHTDNPYRDPCPTLQLLHCLKQAEQGGLTALSDGFHAATRLREEDPRAFELLSTYEVTFLYESNDAFISSRKKIIDLRRDGNIRNICINNRSIAPLQLPFELTTSFYEALAAFRAILECDESQYQFLMQPGDLLLLDNERVLHGRVGESIGTRHLQGCYADRDGLLSTLKVLEQKGFGTERFGAE